MHTPSVITCLDARIQGREIDFFESSLCPCIVIVKRGRRPPAISEEFASAPLDS